MNGPLNSRPLDWYDWQQRKRTELLFWSVGPDLSRDQACADLRLAAELRAAANARPVAQPNWSALGLGSQHLAEGRN